MPTKTIPKLINALNAELLHGTDALRTLNEINEQLDELGLGTPQFDKLALAGQRAATRSAHCLEACEALQEELRRALR
jgi:hypothetical protein